ncbi:MAG: META domain-containing protein [Actinomycetota bacterium]|nr:META domain-containing protein [Actinomycetota bacterium]
MTTSRARRTVMFRSLFATAVVALAFTMASCASEENAPITEDTFMTTWGVEEEGEPHLTFAEDGSVSGSDGCNRLAGSWNLSGDKIVTDNLATTLMACDGVDTWLSGFATAVVDGDRLVVNGTDGEEIGVLQR